MAATDPDAIRASRAPGQVGPTGALLAAALALPGVMPSSALAQAAPDQGLVALKYLDYRDWQPGADRIHVHTPSLYVLKPLSDSLAAEGSLVYDSISGASPLYHNTLSGASGKGGVVDYRTAGDVKVTKYLDRAAIGVGAAISSERDYLSRAVSMDVRLSSDDRNRTYALGVGGASDRIDSTNGLAEDKHRRTVDLLMGVTQALSSEAIIQSNLTWSTGHGYYSDPYKTLDIRPDSRRILAWLTRYNQHLPYFDSTVSLSYRYVLDSFGSDSHTVEAAWYQPLADGWSVKPALRYYTQAAADFYFDPPFPQGFSLGKPYSADTRLSAFGALTPGVTLAKTLPDGWQVDLKVEFYRQRADWRAGANGSPGLEPLSARWIQTGISKTF
ncbi:MAG TPA: DUF3570 domain-containing protein [Casimicrobiaceae bacterium]